MGAQGHDVTGFLPRPNQAKMWSYQGMARGCCSMMYFRYRGAVKGAEQFCYGVIDADNRKRRKFYEVQDFMTDIKQYREALEAPIKSEVAILYDYDSLASFRIQRQSILLDPPAEMQKLYKIFYDDNIMVDVIPSDRDISSYKIVIVPQMIIMDDAMIGKLRDFAMNGGRLVMTYRTAVKDRDNNLTLGEMVPVGMNDLAGVCVEETESLQDLDAFPITGNGACTGQTGHGGIFRDMLTVEDAEVLYRYGDEFYMDYAAVTRKAQGKGSVYYIGCSPDENTLARVLGLAIDEAGIEKTVSPDGVEIVQRGNEKQHIRMLINHNSFRTEACGITLAPFECKVICGE